MKLSYHLLVCLEDLHTVTIKNPYGDLTKLFRLGDKQHPIVDWLFLKDFFDKAGTMVVACEDEVIVGKGLMFCEVKNGKIYARIEGVIVSPPREGILGHILTCLMKYAIPSVHEIDLMRVPGIFRTIHIGN